MSINLFCFIGLTRPNDKTFDLTKFKALADSKIKLAYIMVPVLFDKIRLLEKQKMQITGIFSFSHNIFIIPVSQCH